MRMFTHMINFVTHDIEQAGVVSLNKNHISRYRNCLVIWREKVRLPVCCEGIGIINKPD